MKREKIFVTEFDNQHYWKGRLPGGTKDGFATFKRQTRNVSKISDWEYADVQIAGKTLQVARTDEDNFYTIVKEV